MELSRSGVISKMVRSAEISILFGVDLVEISGANIGGEMNFEGFEVLIYCEARDDFGAHLRSKVSLRY